MDFSTNLAATWLGNLNVSPTWRVFLLCFIVTALGVGIYLLIFPIDSDRFNFAQTVGLGVIVAFAMMGINYAAKYSNAATRDVFTPVDAISYVVQGFAWPALWPSLAAAVGAVVIEPPAEGALFPVLLRFFL